MLLRDVGNMYQTTRHHIREDSNSHSHGRQNLKSRAKHFVLYPAIWQIPHSNPLKELRYSGYGCFGSFLRHSHSSQYKITNGFRGICQNLGRMSSRKFGFVYVLECGPWFVTMHSPAGG
jgi:hypothetical protein